jgi:hypothetical protein
MQVMPSYSRSENEHFHLVYQFDRIRVVGEDVELVDVRNFLFWLFVFCSDDEASHGGKLQAVPVHRHKLQKFVQIPDCNLRCRRVKPKFLAHLTDPIDQRAARLQMTRIRENTL